MEDRGFWSQLDELLATSRLVIDRPTGSAHPRHPDIIYPLDYGYLDDTRGGDGAEVDVWRGSAAEPRLDAVVCTADPKKRDVEVKILLGCTAQDKETILRFHQCGMLVERAP
jgi:inorganic pyrophosphatase